MANFIQKDTTAARTLPRVRGLHIIQGALVRTELVTEATELEEVDENGNKKVEYREYKILIFALGEGEFQGVARVGDSPTGKALLFTRTKIGTLVRLDQLEKYSTAGLQWRFYSGKVGQTADPMFPASSTGVGYNGAAYIIYKILINSPNTNEIIPTFGKETSTAEDAFENLFGIFKGKKVNKIYSWDGTASDPTTANDHIHPVNIFIDDWLDPNGSSQPSEMLDFRTLYQVKDWFSEAIPNITSRVPKEKFYNLPRQDNQVTPFLAEGSDNLDIFFSPRDVFTGDGTAYFTVKVFYVNEPAGVTIPCVVPIGVSIDPAGPLANYSFQLSVFDPDSSEGSPRAEFKGQQGSPDYTSKNALDPPYGDTYADCWIRLKGLDSSKGIQKVRIESVPGGVWESPGNAVNWTIQASSYIPSGAPTVMRSQLHIGYAETVDLATYFDFQSLIALYDLVYSDGGKLGLWPADRKANPDWEPTGTPMEPTVIKRYDPANGIEAEFHLTDGSDGLTPNIDGAAWTWSTKDDRQIFNKIRGHFRTIEKPETKYLSEQEPVNVDREELRQKVGQTVLGQLRLSNMTESQARRVTELQMRRGTDLKKQAEGPVLRTAWRVMPHDVVTLTLRTANYLAQPFLVLERIDDPQTGGMVLKLIEYAEAYSDTETGPIVSPVKGLFPIHAPPPALSISVTPYRKTSSSSGITTGYARVHFILRLAERYRLYWKIGASEWEVVPFKDQAEGVVVPGLEKIVDIPIDIWKEGEAVVQYCFKVVPISGGAEGVFEAAPQACINNNDPALIDKETVNSGNLFLTQFQKTLFQLLQNNLGALVRGVGQLLRNPLFVLGLIAWLFYTAYTLFIRPRPTDKNVAILHSGQEYPANTEILWQAFTGADENDQLIASAEFSESSTSILPSTGLTGKITIGIAFYDSTTLGTNKRPTGTKLGEFFITEFKPGFLTWTRKVIPTQTAPAGTKLCEFVIKAGSTGLKLGGRNHNLLMRNPSLEFIAVADQDDTIHAGFDALAAINDAQANSSKVNPANLFNNTDLRRGLEGWTAHGAGTVVTESDGKWVRFPGLINLNGDSLIERQFTSATIDDTSFIFSCLWRKSGDITDGEVAIALEFYDADGNKVGGYEQVVDWNGDGRTFVMGETPLGATYLVALVRRAYSFSFGWGPLEETNFGFGTAENLIIPSGVYVQFTRFQLERVQPGQTQPSAYTPDQVGYEVAERVYVGFDEFGNLVSTIGYPGGDRFIIKPNGEIEIVDADNNVKASAVKYLLKTQKFTASDGQVVNSGSLLTQANAVLPKFARSPLILLDLAVANPSVDEFGAVNVTRLTDGTVDFTIHAIDKASDNEDSKESFGGEDPVYIYEKNVTTGYTSGFQFLVRSGVMTYTITDMEATVKFTPPQGSGGAASGTATVLVKIGLWDGANFTSRASGSLTFAWNRGGADIFKAISFTDLDVPDNRTELWAIGYYHSDTGDTSQTGSVFVKKLTANPKATYPAVIGGGSYTNTFTIEGTTAGCLRFSCALFAPGTVTFDTIGTLTEAPRSAITHIKFQMEFVGARALKLWFWDWTTSDWTDDPIFDDGTDSILWESSLTADRDKYVSTTGQFKAKLQIPKGTSTNLDYMAVTYSVDPALYLGTGQVTRLLMRNSGADIPQSNVEFTAQMFESAGAQL